MLPLLVFLYQLDLTARKRKTAFANASNSCFTSLSALSQNFILSATYLLRASVFCTIIFKTYNTCQLQAVKCPVSCVPLWLPGKEPCLNISPDPTWSFIWHVLSTGAGPYLPTTEMSQAWQVARGPAPHQQTPHLMGKLEYDPHLAINQDFPIHRATGSLGAVLGCLTSYHTSYVNSQAFIFVLRIAF